MNKNTEKKVYVAPQMTVLQMKTTCQLLQTSGTKARYNQKVDPSATPMDNNGFTIVDFN